MTNEAQKLIDNVTKLFSLPTIYYQVDEAINDPNSTTSQIGHIISEDTGLSARLLKLVNSAFYNFPSKIDTISGAITIIGTKQLRDLILATSVVKLFDGIPDDVINMQSFWLHSIASGVTAKVLATERNEPNVESFFVSGLLHDIGSLIMYSQIPDKSLEAINTAHKEKQLLHVVEKNLLGYTHATVGGLLVKQWRLPANLVDSTTYHHAPHKSRYHHLHTSVVHASDVIVNALKLGSSGERYVPALNEAAWESLNIKSNKLHKIIGIIEHQFEDTARIILQDS